MSDKELLELAAKALHCELDLFPDGTYDLVTEKHIGDVVKRCWNPLTDDGDALRLAVKLRLCVDNCVGEERDRNDVTVGEEAGYGVFVDEYHGADPYSATRRAIVRAAAEIGKAMEDQ